MYLNAWTSRSSRLKLSPPSGSALEQQISLQPDAGVVVTGTGGLRKIRFAPPSWHTGKSGATRVCYVHVLRAEAVGLIAIFAKNEKENLSADDKAFAAKVVKMFHDTLKPTDDDKKEG